MARPTPSALRRLFRAGDLAHRPLPPSEDAKLVMGKPEPALPNGRAVGQKTPGLSSKITCELCALSLFLAASNVQASGATYFMSPTGNDAGDGLSFSSAWLTPNHPLNCGDTIIRAAGTYDAANFVAGRWGVVHNCPSADGIFGARLICAGPYVTSCTIKTTTEGMRVDRSNWAVIGGFYSSSGGGCLWAAPTRSETIHHVAFINVVASGCQYNGIAASIYAAKPIYAVDQFAVVGAVVYNAAQGRAECFAGMTDLDLRAILITSQRSRLVWRESFHIQTLIRLAAPIT